jgi:hypothetical protein
VKKESKYGRTLSIITAASTPSVIIQHPRAIGEKSRDMPETQVNLGRYLAEGSQHSKSSPKRRINTGKRVIPCREGEID